MRINEHIESVIRNVNHDIERFPEMRECFARQIASLDMARNRNGSVSEQERAVKPEFRLM